MRKTLPSLIRPRIKPVIVAALMTFSLSTAHSGEFMDFSIRKMYDGKTQISFGVHTLFTSGTTPITVRALGPSLAGYTSRPVYPDPEIAAYDVTNGHALVGSNDDWGDRDGNGQTDSNAVLDPLVLRMAEAGLVDFAANNSKDAMLTWDLGPSLYQYKVNGPDQSTKGEILIQVANADPTTPTNINGLSMRTKFFNGEEIVFSFTIPEGASQTISLRGRGPNLTIVGVTLPVLSDPILALYDGDTQIAYNDNWQDNSNWQSIENAASTIGLFPLSHGSKDAAILTTLSPGTYTFKAWGGLMGPQTDGEFMIDLFIVP